MKKLAVLITSGAYNRLLQALEFAGVAAQHGVQVSALFRDEAASRMTKDKVRDIPFSEAYRGRETRVKNLLKEQQRHDLAALMREMKERGDVKLSICRDSLAYFDITVDQIIPEIDEVQGLDAFWKEEVGMADQVVAF
ncbi:MAG TPA: DsrE family protein [Nitrospiraceae bacterium]|nr:DsrE family protein [Nitrospiraceae bacterium]